MVLNKIIFHNLCGIRAWSCYNLNKIDVSSIKSLTYKKRSFIFYDDDYAYTLKIRLKNKKTDFVYFGDGDYALINNSNNIITVTKRYKNLKELTHEIEQIKLKQFVAKKQYPITFI